MRIFSSISIRVLALVLLGALSPSRMLQAASNIWSQGANLAEPRAGSAAVLLSDGQVLFTGGAGVSGVLALTELFQLDGSFTPGTPMQQARTRHTAVRLQDGRVLVAGGTTEDDSTTNSAEIY